MTRFHFRHFQVCTSGIALSFLVLHFALTLQSQDLIKRTLDGTETYPKRSVVKFANNLKRIQTQEAASIFNYSPNRNKASSNIRGVSLELKGDFLKIMKQSKIKLAVPVSATATFDMVFEEFKVYSKDFVIEMASGRKANTLNQTKFYRGIISDDPSSVATMSVSNDGVQILISDAWGNYNIGRIKNSQDYLLFNDSDIESPNLNCQTNAIAIPSKSPSGKESPPKISYNKSQGDCIKVHLEVDFRSYQTLNSSETEVMNYINGFFPNVIQLYSNTSIPMELGSVFIWDEDDPYNAEINVGLAYFNMLNGLGGIHTRAGDMKELISIKSCSNCSASGLATIIFDNNDLPKGSALCFNGQFGIYAYGVTELYNTYQNIPVYSWTVQGLTHEMGHNLGGAHTHACVWGTNEDQTIDDCGNQWAVTNNFNDNQDTLGMIDEPEEAEGFDCWDSANPQLPNKGTIMSYCHLNGYGGIDLSLGFGTEIGNHLLAEYNAKTCFTPCSGGDCTTSGDIVIEGQSIATDQTIRTSGDHIQTELDASVTISNSANVTWQSKLSVILNKIFTVDQNAQLEVIVDDCNN